MHRLISVATGELHWQIAPEYRELLLDHDGLRLDDWLQSGHARIAKDGPHRTVYHVVLPELDCYVKRNRVHDTRAYLRQLDRPAKARIEFDHALLIAGRGIDTITPLAVGEARSANGDSFLVTRGLRDTTPLGDFLEQQLPALGAERQPRIRQRLTHELARLLARMHEAGIRHDDLHPGNFLVRLDDNDDPSLFLIDLHAVKLGPRL
ncbi:MAG: lipopolysaccharide kinase InaA family protein, partial [Gemmataceae bacterium]